LDNAILILRAVTDEFPQSWEAYDALGETYMMRGDAEDAARSLEKSLRLNSQNTHAAELLKSLETQ
jgi:cytochrome c-type biogenesis protein CcmH/NrfG